MLAINLDRSGNANQDNGSEQPLHMAKTQDQLVPNWIGGQFVSLLDAFVVDYRGGETDVH